MAGYTRQSTMADGDTITAALFNNEYNQLVNAFSNTSGHAHDGTAGEGPVIGLIGDAGETTPLNKVLIDTVNNYIEFYVDVSSSSVQQLYIADGAIIPVTDNDIDLGTSSLEFKNLYLDGTATIDTLTVDEAATIGTTLGVTGATTLSSTLGVTGATTLSSTLGVTGATTLSSTLAVTGTSTLTGNVTASNDLSVGGNLTVTGNATISGNLTFGDADTDSITLTADVASHITPDVDDTYDLGTSLKEWRNLYIDGTANIDSLVADTADINAGTIDNTVIGGTTAVAGSFTTATATTGNITNVNATTVDTTNIEVSNVKAKDGTASATIADATGVMTIASSVLTTADINGGTIDNTAIGSGTASSGAFTTLSASGATTLSSTLGVTGAATFNGNVTVGDAATDTLTITADVASNIIPSADSTYTLGDASNYWSHGYIDALTTTGNVIVGGNLTVNGQPQQSTAQQLQSMTQSLL
jgi:cytoskeletal protein CcmA (bactofilin family)